MSTLEKSWITQAGLKACVLLVGDPVSHRCGYVAVPKGHPLFGKSYHEQLDLISQERASESTVGQKSPLLILTASVDGDEGQVRRSLDIVIDVHGGITYASEGGKYPEPESDPSWWFGFDCAHSGDGTLSNEVYRRGPVRTLEFCIEQCENMAKQLQELVA